MIYHFIAIVLAVFIDMLIGDPPNWPHPVKGFGKLISFFDKMWNYGSNRKLKGVLMLIILIAIVFSLSVGLVALSYFFHPILGVGIEAILIRSEERRVGKECIFGWVRSS